MSNLFQRCVGLLVLIAAGLKTAQLLETPVEFQGLGTRHLWQSIQISIEWILGALIVSSVLPSLTRPLTLLMFSIFSVVAGIEVWMGAASCGCFGEVHVDPLVVFGLDVFIVLVVLAIGVFRPIERPTNIRPAPRLVVFLLLTIAGCAGQIVTASWWKPLNPAFAADDNEQLVFESGSFVAIQPEKLLDKPFRLADYIVDGDQLLRGRWVVVLFRPDCNKCHSLAALFLEQGASVFSAPAESKVAWVNASNSRRGLVTLGFEKTATAAADHIHSKLVNDYRWVVEAPLVLYIDNGVVARYATFASLEESWQR